MSIHDFLDARSVFLNLDLKTPHEVFEYIASKTSVPSGIPEQKIIESLRDREASGSTGLGGGLALPHSSFTEISDFFIGVITTRSPIMFRAFDRKPCRFFIYMLAPKSQPNRHVKILSGLASALQKENMDRLLQAQTPEELLQLLDPRTDSQGSQGSKDSEKKSSAPNEGKNPQRHYRLEVLIQIEEYFDLLLEELSSFTDGALYVQDASDAGSYLQKIPLFSSIWTGEQNHFMKIVTVIIPGEEAESIIWRLSSKLPPLREGSGIMLTCHELSHIKGTLNF